MGCTAEDEYRVYVGQSPQLYLGERFGLLQSAEGLLHQPAAADEASGINDVPCDPSIDVRAAAFVLLKSAR